MGIFLLKDSAWDCYPANVNTFPHIHRDANSLMCRETPQQITPSAFIVTGLGVFAKRQIPTQTNKQIRT
jgi:hypothetical protein